MMPKGWRMPNQRNLRKLRSVHPAWGCISPNSTRICICRASWTAYLVHGDGWRQDLGKWEASPEVQPNGPQLELTANRVDGRRNWLDGEWRMGEIPRNTSESATTECVTV